LVPELWNPLTGERTRPARFASAPEGVTIPLVFGPGDSTFVIFRKPAGKAGLLGSSPRESAAAAAVPAPASIEISGPWELSFDPKWGGPEHVTFATLDDWSKRPESGIKYYSGTAVYRKTVAWPEKVSGQRYFLDLGSVKNLARVCVNGRDCGVVWCSPWRVDISGALASGTNQLAIEVANLWPNRLIGDLSLPVAKRFDWTTRNPFQPDSPLLPSGLLGPVRVEMQMTNEIEL